MVTFMHQLLITMFFILIAVSFVITYKKTYSYINKNCSITADNTTTSQNGLNKNNFITSIKEHFSQYKTNCGIRKKTIDKTEYSRNMVIYFCCIVIVIIALSFFCSTTTGGYDLLYSLALPFLIISMVIMAFNDLYKSNWLFSFLAVVLILLGVALQVMLNLSAANATNRPIIQLAIFAALGLLFAFLAIPILTYLVSHKTIAIYFSVIASILFYVILILFGSKTSGTTAWIKIAGQSFQLTEITKILGFVTFASMFTAESVSPKKRLLSATVVLLVHAAFLFLISELGTLLILAIVYVLLGLVYLPSVKIMLKYILVLTLISAIASGIGYACYKTVYTTAYDTTVISSSIENTEENQETDTQPHNKLVIKAADIFNKLRLRVVLVIDPESVDAYDEGYQANAAINALAMSGWLGSEYEQCVPVIESDYIFLFILMKLGVVWGIGVILIIVFMFVLFIFNNYLKNRNVGESAISFAFMSSLVIQAILTTASAIGCFPTVGLPFPFLSLGGSATLINYVMLIFIIFTGQEKVTDQSLELTANPTSDENSRNKGEIICRIHED